MTVQTLGLEKKMMNMVLPINSFLNAPRKRVYDSLPYEDGEVLESHWHRNSMNQLIETIKESWVDGPRCFTSGNMFVYFDPNQVKNHNFRGPDFFVVTEVDPDPSRKSWVVWDENNRVPNIVIELSSPSTKEVDFGQKKNQYEQILKVKDYFIYDPDSRELVGWRLQGGVYVALKPNEQGWLWSEELRLWVGVHYSTYHKDEAYYPRFFDEQGQLLLNTGEAKEREKQRAERAELRTERERRDKERAQFQTEQAELRAAQERRDKEQAQFQAEIAELRAEEERRDKEQAQFQAEQAELRAEQERRDKERLAAKLRELGIDPTTILG